MVGEFVAKILVKRVYADVETGDGFRILVDRLWPRGVTKERAAVDLWFKDIAPSTEARKEFGHMTERFAEFTAHYQAELSANPAVSQALELVREHPVVTLLYAAKDVEHNHALVLREFLLGQLAQ